MSSIYNINLKYHVDWWLISLLDSKSLYNFDPICRFFCSLIITDISRVERFCHDETAIATMDRNDLSNQGFLNTEKYFRNLIKSNRNQIVFAIFFGWFGTANGHCPFVVSNQSRKLVNTIWFQFDLIWFRSGFSVRNSIDSLVRAAGTAYLHSPSMCDGQRQPPPRTYFTFTL